MFNRKQREIERLRYSRMTMSNMLNERDRLIHEATGKIAKLEETVEELERTNQPSYDMNVLFAAVLDYRRCLRHLGGPDPVEGQRELKKVFEKYRVKF